MEILYKPTNNKLVTDLEIYFDGTKDKTFTAQFTPLKGLKIFAGQGYQAPDNIILKDFKFGKFSFSFFKKWSSLGKGVTPSPIFG